jgi:hypothetical protein
MANLIRLKQIEGSNELSAAVNVGAAVSASGGSFTQAVDTAVVASINTNLSSSISTIVSSSLTTVGFVTTSSFHSYTASLGNTFATDQEVYLTASAIIDQGEF